MRVAPPLIIFVLLAPLVPIAPATGGDACDVEPADGAYAFPADCSGSVPGGFATPAEFYAFSVPERARLVFHITNDGTAFHDTILVDLYRPDGSIEIGPAAGRGSTVRMGAVAEEAGVWRLRLDGFGMEEHAIPYRFTARLEEAPPPVAPQDDCGSGGDAPGAWWSLDLALPADCEGDLTWSDDIDGYGNDAADTYDFRLREGETLVASATVQPGTRICVHVYTDHDNVCMKRRANETAGSFEAALRAPEDTGGTLSMARVDPLDVHYGFSLSVVEPTWHEQVEDVRLELGAPQPFAPAPIGPDRKLLGQSVPEGFAVAWIPLDRAVQQRRSLDLSWRTPLPAGVTLYLTDADGERSVDCGSGEGGTSITCDRESTAGWGSARWVELVWAAVVVEVGVEVDATLTYRYWTFGA